MGIFKSITRIFDRGRGLAELAQWLDLPQGELGEWSRGRPPEPRGREYYYNRFGIAKRHGGEREIDAPSEVLKGLQRRVLHRLLNPLPMHPSATGFVEQRSIVTNAQPHAGQNVVINIDLADFFPSISAEKVRQAIRGLGWNKECADILTHICTHEGRLPQGAPTSPALSNLACRHLDTRLAQLAAGNQGQYTRYADDITLSFPALRRGRRPQAKSAPRVARRRLICLIREIIEDEGFRIQMKKKVRIQRAHQRQTATGLVVNQRVNLPREFRRRIRAAEHHERLGKLDATRKARLRGWQALLKMVASQRVRATTLH